MSRRKGPGVGGRRPVGWRTLRRRVLPVAGALVVALSMATAVRRGAEARRISREVEALRRTEEVTRDRLRRALRRVDSLSSRERILEAAAPLGLRPARGGEVVYLADVSVAPPAAEREKAGPRR